MTRKFSRGLFAAFLMCVLAPIGPIAHAQSEDDLLPVEQAFKLTAKIAEPGKIALHWDIAPDYYLYRTRIKAKTAQAGATLADIDLPAGTKKHDEFIGDVEVYHQAIDATLPYTLADAATKTLAVTMTVQGCHEVDPKICYPPHPTTLTLDVPAAMASAAATRCEGRRRDAPGIRDEARPQSRRRTIARAKCRANRCRPSRRSSSKPSLRVRPACSRAGRCRRVTTSIATRVPFLWWMARTSSSVRRNGPKASTIPTSISARSSSISIRSSCRFLSRAKRARSRRSSSPANIKVARTTASVIR